MSAPKEILRWIEERCNRRHRKQCYYWAAATTTMKLTMKKKKKKKKKEKKKMKKMRSDYGEFGYVVQAHSRGGNTITEKNTNAGGLQNFPGLPSRSNWRT